TMSSSEAQIHESVKQVLVEFKNEVKPGSLTAYAIAAMKALNTMIAVAPVTTFYELEHVLLDAAIKSLCDTCDEPSVSSGCDVYKLFVTRGLDETYDNFEHCRQQIVEKGKRLISLFEKSRTDIARRFVRSMHDSSVVLLHGFSRVVMQVVEEGIRWSRRGSGT
ncbi:initiation factor 2B-related, partial [Kipferlia bialata]